MAAAVLHHSALTLPIEVQHLEVFKAYQEKDNAELKRLEMLKPKYLKPSNIIKPSQLSSIREYVEDISPREFRAMKIPILQQEIWQWFMDFPSERKTFLDFRWGTSGYTTRCPSYQIAQQRIVEAGYTFSDYSLMEPILAFLENQDPHALCKLHIDGLHEALEFSLKSGMAILDKEENAKISSIASWTWPNNPHKPTLDVQGETKGMSFRQTPDICVFFHIRDHQKSNTKKFWMKEKHLLQPTIIISRWNKSMDLEIKNLIPWQLAYLSDEVHFPSAPKECQKGFMWDHNDESVKAEMKNVGSDKKILRIVYGYIDGHTRYGVCELVMPLPCI